MSLCFHEIIILDVALFTTVFSVDFCTVLADQFGNFYLHICMLLFFWFFEKEAVSKFANAKVINLCVVD